MYKSKRYAVINQNKAKQAKPTMDNPLILLQLMSVLA